MDIYLCKESVFHHFPQVSVEVAIDRLEQKKVQLVSGTLGSIFSRTKPEDIQLVSVENRLEAYWVIKVHLKTVYERNRTYKVPLTGKEIEYVTINGQDYQASADAKGENSFSMNGVEHCLEELQQSFAFDGSGAELDVSKYQGFPKTEVINLEDFAPESVVVIPPKALASTIVRSVLSKVIKPIDAQIIQEERIDIEALEINFKPVYAMEYDWTQKNKKVVLEFDALTGEILGQGQKLGDTVKGMVTTDFLFDVTAVTAGALVPGGSLAVKLVKVAYDHKKK
jgi:hypothetical protein